MDVGRLEPHHRCVLLTLSAKAGDDVTLSELIRTVYGDDRQTSDGFYEESIVHQVSRLRKVLGTERLPRRRTGDRTYRLDIPREDVDLLRFADLARDLQLRAGDLAASERIDAVRTALALWRERPTRVFSGLWGAVPAAFEEVEELYHELALAHVFDLRAAGRPSEALQRARWLADWFPDDPEADRLVDELKESSRDHRVGTTSWRPREHVDLVLGGLTADVEDFARVPIEAGADVDIGRIRVALQHPAQTHTEDYTLNVMWATYQVGAYENALFWAQKLMRDGTALSLEQRALFSYACAKTLLKLNRYDELERFLSLVFEPLSEVMRHAIAPELLEIKGVLRRHQGDLLDAICCFDAAVEELESLGSIGDAERPAVLRIALGDALVLRAQVLLDHAIGRADFDTALRSARSAMAKARRQYEGVESESHFEGRYFGTSAFVVVVESLLVPESLDEDRWTSARLHAQQAGAGTNRKSLGRLAGRYAEAMVSLAEALWRTSQAPGDPLVDVLLKDAGERLDDILSDDQTVFLGPLYERPKLADAAAVVRRISQDGPVAVKDLDRGIFTPLV